MENTSYIQKAREVPAEFSAYATFKEVDEKEQRYTQKYIKSWSNGEKLTLRPVNGGHYVHWTDERLLTEIHDFLKAT